MTPFQKHVADWSDCHDCPLFEYRTKVVLARGRYPAPILFIGEAPGKSEDIMGLPFKGRAGKLLDRILLDVDEMLGFTSELNKVGGLHFAMTNIVACIPLENPQTKSPEPESTSIAACKPRLKEFVRICKPKLIVLVGGLARKHVKSQAEFSVKRDGSLEWLAEGQDLKFIEIRHPAFILRNNIASQGLEIQRCCIAIKNAIIELREENIDDLEPKAQTLQKSEPAPPAEPDYPDDDIPF